MFIYKLLFIVFNIGNIFSSIFFMVGVGVHMILYGKYYHNGYYS